ncbi:hypothetical protein I3900191A7_09070 [Clostridium baratii]|uniref:Uncharacterized protein n=1 Tax=Clostridium nitritogenes TaxID=83340 RepID=A0ABN1LQ23_9CLOT|nr:hypothetical protein [Clostridium baratii]
MFTHIINVPLKLLLFIYSSKEYKIMTIIYLNDKIIGEFKLGDEDYD